MTFVYIPDRHGVLLGTNTTHWRNALKTASDWLNLTNLIIPSYLDNKPVISIGQYSFFNCLNLENIEIHANITVIHRLAFMGCYKLRHINIPASCETIYHSAIDCRYQKAEGNSIYNEGPLTIVFDPGSKLKSCESTSIFNAVNYVVYVYDKIYPTHHNDVFKADINYTVTVYSPYSFRFFGFPTKPLYPPSHKFFPYHRFGSKGLLNCI